MSDFNAELVLIRQIDNLTQQLEKKGREISHLEDEIEELQSEINALNRRVETLQEGDPWGWRHLRRLKNSPKGWDEIKVEDTNFDLPTPRLELRYRTYTDHEQVIDYGLVLEHLLGHIEFIPISSTKCGGFDNYYITTLPKEQKDLRYLQTPFRDGAHIHHDMEKTGLPGYVVNPEKKMYLQLSSDPTKASDAADIVYVDSNL